MIHKKDFSVYLRAFEPDDYLLINKWRNDMEMQKLTCGPIRFVSTEMEKAWVHGKMMNNQTDIYLAICVNNDAGKMIGYTSLNHIDYINRSICGGGIVIGDNDYRDGQALVEVHYMVLDYAFGELNMHRFYAKCLDTHVLSISYMEAFYYEREGVARDSIYKCGSFHNTILWSMLRDEFFKHKKNGDFSVSVLLKRMIQGIRTYRMTIKNQ